MDINKLRKFELDDLTFSVVDTETSGMLPQFCRVIDIGIVKVKKGEIVDTWETLVDPEQQIDYWITKYTSLRNKDIKGKPKFIEIADSVGSMLDNTVFVAHNVMFDYLFLFHEMKRLEKNFFYPKLCTVQLGRKLVPHLDHANLDILSDYFNIKIKNRHRALPDAYATALIFIEFIKMAKLRYSAKTFFDLERLQWLKGVKSEEFDNNPLF